MEAEAQHAEIPPVETYPAAAPEPATPVIPEAPVQVVANQLGDVAVDAGRLLELQIRLFEAECLQSGKKLVEPAALLVASVVLMLAAAIVLLLAIGTGLHELASWPLSVCLLLVVVGGMAVAGGVLWYALDLLRTPRVSFEKSKEELMRNIAALSRVLKPQ